MLLENVISGTNECRYDDSPEKKFLHFSVHLVKILQIYRHGVTEIFMKKKY